MSPLVQLHLKPGKKTVPSLDKQHQLILHLGEGTRHRVKQIHLVTDHGFRADGTVSGFHHAPVNAQRVPGQDYALVRFGSFHVPDGAQARPSGQEIGKYEHKGVHSDERL